MELLLNNINFVMPVCVLLAVSLALRLLLQALGQLWIKTIAHTATICLLPILTYIITSVISGNIALSLGMVGALSIVRFRNPVRSPLELSVYFGAITMGIAAAVSLKWLLLLVASLVFVAIFLAAISSTYAFLSGNSFFTTSFAEGNHLSTLTITSTAAIELLDESNYLMSKTMDGSGWMYVLSHSDFNKLKDLEKRILMESNISTSSLNK